MVFVKVRETYDLHTIKNKMTVIGIHTPHPDIIKRNYPGLLMQCKAYRPVSCDVRVACASMEQLDPLQVGTAPGSIAPEDAFNPILYKAMSNFGMSQLEARINAIWNSPSLDVEGTSASVDVDSVTSYDDEFDIYYGLLADTNSWKHASPQAGLSMTGLKPLVWEMVYNIGDNRAAVSNGEGHYGAPLVDGAVGSPYVYGIRGGSKPMPFINCTSYTWTNSSKADSGFAQAGFPDVYNSEVEIPWLCVMVAGLVIPPSKLHEFYYRMVVEWTIEFSSVRSIIELQNLGSLGVLGAASHYQNYDYASTKEAITGDSSSIMDNDSCMVSANVDVNKVM